MSLDSHMFGRPPSGQPVEQSAIVLFRIADGKIAERWAAFVAPRAEHDRS